MPPDVLGIAESLGLHPDTVTLTFGADVSTPPSPTTPAALQVGDRIEIRPHAPDLHSVSGRLLLAHELVHVAQRRLPVHVPTGTTPAAEAEANDLARWLVDGRPSRGPPTRRLTHGETAWAPTDAELKLLTEQPPRFRHSSVHLYGIQYVPAATGSWHAGIEKKLQALAAVLLDMVGGASFTPELVRAAYDANGGDAGIVTSGQLEGVATSDNTWAEFRIGAPLAYDLLQWLKKPPRNLKVTITDAQIDILLHGLIGQWTWRDMRDSALLPVWFPEAVFVGITATTAKTKLFAYGQALQAHEQAPTDDTELALEQARNAVYDHLADAAWGLDLVRDDSKLADHPVWRTLWGLPALREGETPTPVVVAEDQTPDISLAVLFMNEALREPGKTLARDAYKAENRRTLLDRLGTVATRMKISLGGDTTLGDQAAKAFMDPLDSELRAWPSLEPPFFDVPKGSERDFQMSLRFPDIFEAFRSYSFRWEVLKVPSNDIAKLQETADDLATRGETAGMTDVLGSRLSRDLRYAGTDMARSIGSITNLLGPPGMGATTLTAVASMLRMIGTVIRTIIETLFKPKNEKTFPFSGTGLFIVRCIATPWPREGSVIDRASSVAWVPLWVRPAEEMSKLRVELDRKLADGSWARLADITDELRGLTTALANDQLPQDQRDKLLAQQKALQDEKALIEASLLGSGKDVIASERKALLARKASGEAQPFEIEAIDKRLGELDTIESMRASRMAGAPAEGSLEGPFRVSASFVADTGSTIRLLLEAYERSKPSTDGTVHVHVVDSTTKNSGHRDGDGPNRADAVAEGTRTILESDQGYGRGYATLWVPLPVTFAGAGERGDERTIRVDKDLAGVVMEGIEGLALAISIAAIVAAPFTGGASLAILVPVGVIGAIPSAYRLIDRGMQGTLRMDLATVMDALNIIGAAVGLGTYQAGAKAALTGVAVSRGWMIAGLGIDGLTMLVTGYGVLEQLRNIDPNAPPGVRRAMAMEIFGNFLLQIGMAVGGTLAAKGTGDRSAAGWGDKKPTALEHPRIGAELETTFRTAVGAAGTDIPVHRDTAGVEVRGNGVEIRYDLDGYGLPTNVHVVAGPTAGAGELLVHAKVAKAMIRYQGLSGWLRSLLDRLWAIVGGKGDERAPHPPGSRAWEAWHELRKLPAEVARVHDLLKQGKVHPDDAATYVDHLKHQMQQYEQVLAQLELAPGRGKVAAEAPGAANAAAIAAGYPKEIPLDHYYVAEPDGSYSLHQHLNSTAPRYEAAIENGVKVVRPVKTTPTPTLPVADDAAKAGPKLAPAPTAAKPPDPALLATRVRNALKLGPGATTAVSLHADLPAGAVVSVRPPTATGGGYEIHYPPGATDMELLAAIAAHVELRVRRRSLDRNGTYLGPRGGRVPWTGTEEAAFLGRPPAKEGYHWAKHGDDLHYVKDDPDAPKLVWDDKLHDLVPDKGRTSESFDPAATRSEAFDLLGGPDPATAFGSWVELAMKELGLTRAQLEAAMIEPGGKSHDYIRGELKGLYNDRLTAKFTDPAKIEAQYPKRFTDAVKADPAKHAAALAKASHEKMLDMTADLGSSDRGAFAEKWYLAIYGSKPSGAGKAAKPGAVAHVKLSQSELANPPPNKGLDPVVISKDRVPDLLDGSTLKDVKHLRGPVGEHDKSQFDDFEKVVGKTILVDGTPTKIETFAIAFPEPAGGYYNADYIAKRLDSSPVNLEVEVFNTRGERKVLTKDDLKPSAFNPKGGTAGLGQAIKNWTGFTP